MATMGVAGSPQTNPKMLCACSKIAATNPLVANTGVIHKCAWFPGTFRTFFVGGPKASWQLPIIGRQRRRTTGTSRVVARLAGRERTDLRGNRPIRSEEHTSELQTLMSNSYAVFCLKKKNKHN